MIQIGSNGVRKEISYLMIEPLVPHKVRSEKNNKYIIILSGIGDGSELEWKNDQKTLTKLKDSRAIFSQLVFNGNQRRDLSRSDSSSRSSRRRVRQSRSRERRDHHQRHHRHLNPPDERSREIEQPTASESSDLIDTETIAHLREKHPTPKEFAANLILKLFTLDELIVRNVNVEGLKKIGTNKRVIALSPTRVAELKRHCLQNVAIDERESMWKMYKKACNDKLWQLRANKDRKRVKK